MGDYEQLATASDHARGALPPLPFAYVEDLERRWRPMGAGERERAEALLMDASVKIAAAMSRCGAPPGGAADGYLERSLVSVCCSMVARAMQVPDGMLGVTSHSQGAIGMTESFSYANPGGDLYMTRAEREQLGLAGRSRIWSIRPSTGGDGRA